MWFSFTKRSLTELVKLNFICIISKNYQYKQQNKKMILKK